MIVNRHRVQNDQASRLVVALPFAARGDVRVFVCDLARVVCARAKHIDGRILAVY